MACIVIAYIVMGYTVIAYIGMGYTVIAFIVVALYSYGRYSYGLYSYGVYSSRITVNACARCAAGIGVHVAHVRRHAYGHVCIRMFVRACV